MTANHPEAGRNGLPAPAIDAEERAALTSRAAIASITMAIALALLKAWAAWRTGSVAMLGSLADSGLDVLASAVTLYAVRLSAEPADRDHRFGHGKAEALGALFQTGIITASAIAIGWRGVMSLGNAAAPAHPEAGVAVSVVAIGATLVLVAYQRHVVRKTKSVAIHADHVHYSSDIALNGAVIVALALDSWLGIRGADPVFGIAIALWLLYHARDVAHHALNQLMDKEWPLSKREHFVAVASQHPELRGIHDMRTRTSGAQDFVQFHVWVDGNLTVREAHRIMDEIEEQLMQEFPGTEVLIHPDPDGHQDEEMGYVPSLTVEHQDPV